LSQKKRGKPLRSDELKAVLVHTAVSPSLGPTYKIGWGAIDASAAGRVLAGDLGTLITGKLNNTRSIKIAAEPVGGAIRATLCWIDPAGQPNGGGLNDRTPALVRDLDLIVKNSSGKQFFPWSLTAASPAAKATNDARNERDNVERVDVPVEKVAGGTWTIEVVGPDHADDQMFALVLTGLKPK
jgi:hypothetical protein